MLMHLYPTGNRSSSSSRRRRRLSDRGRRAGAAAVEFAFVAPFLLLLLLGMMEFSRVLMGHHVLTIAARTGAREAVLPGATTSSVEAAAEAVAAAATIPLSSINVSCSSDPASTIPGSSISVTVAAPMSVISSLGETWFGPTHQISTVASMRKEGFE